MDKIVTIDSLGVALQELGLVVVIYSPSKEKRLQGILPALRVEAKDHKLIIKATNKNDCFLVNGDVTPIFGAPLKGGGIRMSSGYMIDKLERFLKKEESTIDQSPLKGFITREGDVIDSDSDSYISKLSHHFYEIAKKEDLPLKVEDWKNKDGARILDAIMIIKKYILDK